jgi:hypothetical protein
MAVFFPQTATDTVRKDALSFGTFLQNNLSLYCKKIVFDLFHFLFTWPEFCMKKRHCITYW